MCCTHMTDNQGKALEDCKKKVLCEVYNLNAQDIDKQLNMHTQLSNKMRALARIAKLQEQRQTYIVPCIHSIQQVTMHFLVNRNNVNNYMLTNTDAYILGSSSAKTSSFGHQSFLPGQPPPLINPGSAPGVCVLEKVANFCLYIVYTMYKNIHTYTHTHTCTHMHTLTCTQSNRDAHIITHSLSDKLSKLSSSLRALVIANSKVLQVAFRS